MLDHKEKQIEDIMAAAHSDEDSDERTEDNLSIADMEAFEAMDRENRYQYYMKLLNNIEGARIEHILNGSKNKNHHWEELVPDRNWETIKLIIAETMTAGEEVVYKKVGKCKRLQMGAYRVEVTYFVVGGLERISDAWVVVPET